MLLVRRYFGILHQPEDLLLTKISFLFSLCGFMLNQTQFYVLFMRIYDKPNQFYVLFVRIYDKPNQSYVVFIRIYDKPKSVLCFVREDL